MIWGVSLSAVPSAPGAPSAHRGMAGLGDCAKVRIGQRRVRMSRVRVGRMVTPIVVLAESNGCHYRSVLK